MRGDTAAIRTLLAQKADVNLTQSDGATAIQWAAYRNDTAMADLAHCGQSRREDPQPRWRDSAAPSQCQRQRGNDRSPDQGWCQRERNRTERRNAADVRLAQRQSRRSEGAHRRQGRRKRERKGSWHHAFDVGHRTIVSGSRRGRSSPPVPTFHAKSNNDTKGNSAYLANPVKQRLKSGFGVQGDTFGKNKGGQQGKNNKGKATPTSPDDVAASRGCRNRGRGVLSMPRPSKLPSVARAILRAGHSLPRFRRSSELHRMRQDPARRGREREPDDQLRLVAAAHRDAEP